jgi:isoleucyl-tRNA synthetase
MFLVNSPIVRGDNLRFQEEGVRDIITKVLLPWLNALRFFLGQAALFEKETGSKFIYRSRDQQSENIMDRWIVARCQSLIRLVNQEMAAYRLYTVIPRLLDLVGDLTNWYIRFNRSRLKGQEGREDARTALNTLCETLFTLCRTMVSHNCMFRLSVKSSNHLVFKSSFTPFITESVYQALRSFMMESESEDLRSVHFLSFPNVKNEYFDATIQRQVQRMQTVIELTRAIREKLAVSLKVRVTSYCTVS